MPSLPLFLTYVDWSVIHPNSFRSGDSKPKVVAHLPGSGPYTIAEVQSEGNIARRIELVRNPWWHEKVLFQKVSFLNFKECHELRSIVDKLIALRAYTDSWTEECDDWIESAGFKKFVGPTTWSLKAVFTKKAKRSFPIGIRLGLAQRIRKRVPEAEVLNRAGYFVSYGLRPPGHWGTLTSDEFDHALSAVPADNKLLPPKLIVVAQDSWSRWRGYVWFVNELKAMGIDVDFIELSANEYSAQLLNGQLQEKYDLVLSPLGVGDPDPDGSFRIAKRYYFSEEITDKQLADAFFEVNREKRAQIYKNVEKTLLLSGSYIPLFFTSQIVIVHSSFRIKGLSQIYHGVAAFDMGFE